MGPELSPLLRAGYTQRCCGGKPQGAVSADLAGGLERLPEEVTTCPGGQPLGVTGGRGLCARSMESHRRALNQSPMIGFLL